MCVSGGGGRGWGGNIANLEGWDKSILNLGSKVGIIAKIGLLLNTV